VEALFSPLRTFKAAVPPDIWHRQARPLVHVFVALKVRRYYLVSAKY
jgi:hypothetical protein